MALVAQLQRHVGKKIAFNAGRHRLKGTIINVDTKFFIVDVRVEFGAEPGVHMMRIGRMDKIAFLEE